MDRIAPQKLPPLPTRPRDAHKGTFGRVLVVGGSRGMLGAAALAGQAAFRGGAGLVTLAVPQTLQQAIATLCPCATSLPLSTGPGGELASAAVREVLSAAEAVDYLAVGPGFGVGTVQQDVVRTALAGDRPVVLDADGLNNLARIEGWWEHRCCPLVLTPHPGEFARLRGLSVGEVQADRPAAIAAALGAWRKDASPPLVVVLKGAGTLVADGRQLYENDTGNPGLATGGTGDVLTGFAAGLLGQSLELFDAVCLAVRAHGRAGDLAAAELTETALCATDLLETLPQAVRELQDPPP